MIKGNTCTNSRVYTTHGKKKNQGKVAIVNGHIAICYTEGKNEEVVGDTLLSEIVQKSGMGLPQYQLDF